MFEVRAPAGGPPPEFESNLKFEFASWRPRSVRPAADAAIALNRLAWQQAERLAAAPEGTGAAAVRQQGARAGSGDAPAGVRGGAAQRGMPPHAVISSQPADVLPCKVLGAEGHSRRARDLYAVTLLLDLLSFLYATLFYQSGCTVGLNSVVVLLWMFMNWVDVALLVASWSCTGHHEAVNR